MDRLEKRRLVRRVRQSRDRRQIHVEITAEGADFIENAPDPLRDRFVTRLKAMAPEEFEKILWAIDTLAVMMNSSEDPDSDDPGPAKTPLP